MTYLQVGNFEEVFRGIAEIRRDVHQAVKHVNFITLRVGKRQTQTPNHLAAGVRFAPSNRALELVFPPESSSDELHWAISWERATWSLLPASL